MKFSAIVSIRCGDQENMLALVSQFISGILRIVWKTKLKKFNDTWTTSFIHKL